ncbi:MAG: hypothetical protein ACR2FO_08690 [Actinomycetota bacterium]
MLELTPKGTAQIRLIAAILSTFLLAACSGQNQAGGKVTFETSSPKPGAVESPGVVESKGGLLDFQAPKLGGGVVNGADFAGQDLALWFWAPW